MAGSNAEVTVDLKGKKIFVSECIKVTAGITLGVKQLSAIIVPGRLSSDAIVVADVAKPGLRNHWVAILLGIPIVGVGCLTGRRYPAITYAAAVSRKFNVCITPGFRQRFHVLSTIITRAVEKPHARWKLKSASAVVLEPRGWFSQHLPSVRQSRALAPHRLS